MVRVTYNPAWHVSSRDLSPRVARFLVPRVYPALTPRHSAIHAGRLSPLPERRSSRMAFFNGAGGSGGFTLHASHFPLRPVCHKATPDCGTAEWCPS